MLFHLVLRNITRNKKNSAIVALLVAVITFLFFTGNNLIGMTSLGIRHSFIESLTGDVVLQRKSDVTMSLFGANVPIIDVFYSIPVIPVYDIVLEIIRSEDRVAGITNQVSGQAILDMLGVRDPALLCGVDTETYFSLFPGIVLEEGRFLRNGEFGAMITAERARRIYRESGQYPEIGTPMLFTSGGGTGFKIREVPLVGIFSYRSPNQLMNEIVIIDPQTVRILNSIQVAASQNIELRDDDEAFLTVGIDNIFDMDSVWAGESTEEEFSAEFLRTWLSETGIDEDAGLAGGDWNFIILRLKEGVSASAFINYINEKLEPYNVVAVDWRTAAGAPAILLLLIQILFNLGMFLVCVAGVIAAINILLISVFRRTREIGTLRAIGASDFCIRSLILQENLVIAVVAAFIGIIGGFCFFHWINTMELIIQNELLISLFGGSALTLEVLPGVAGLSFILAVVLGLVTSILPMEVTVRVEPMTAIRKE
jgi:ABC-type lipoprotein release transport system permease subunit